MSVQKLIILSIHKKSIICFFIILIIFLSSIQANCSELQKPKTNFELIDSLAKISAKNICDYIKSYKIDSIILNVPVQAEGVFLKNKIIEAAQKVNIFCFDFDNSNFRNLPRLDIIINSFGVNYNIIPEVSDSLTRNISVLLTGTLICKSKELSAAPLIEFKYTDIIDRNDILGISNPDYPYTQSNVPPPEKSFFQDILEPIIFISTGIITVILFFTVRSG